MSATGRWKNSRCVACSKVLRHYREIKGIHTVLAAQLLAERPAAFVGIDAPDFNLDLEIQLKQAGIPTVHYVSPSIWGWRPGRIKKIAQAVSHMLVLFPFEEALYQQAGVPVTYVGHPMAEVIAMRPDVDAARRALGLASDARVVAILPGSRLSELKYHTAAFIEAAKLLSQRDASLKFVVPMAGERQRAHFVELLQELSLQDVPLQIIDGQSHDAMAAADAVLVASGTATLEVALHKKTDGRGLQAQLGDLAGRQAHGDDTLVRLAEHSGAGNRGAGIPAGAGHAAGPGRCRLAAVAGYGATRPPRTAFHGFTPCAFAQYGAIERASRTGCDAPAMKKANDSLPLFDDWQGELICGVDEAGRGPLAGPVYAAAVILDPSRPIAGLQDSKKLSEARRDTLAEQIKTHALAWSIAHCTEEEIDRLNILQATMLAMRRAVEGLQTVPTLALIDGNRCPVMPVRAEAIVKGDAKVPAISAASILAKTARDAVCMAMHAQYPQYAFDQHKGYPTALHLERLREHGVSPVHRRSYGPVKALLG